MIVAQPDTRSPERKAEDERIAAEVEREFPSPPEIPPGTPLLPIEVHLARIARRPVAVAGVVENGVVRLLDPDVTFAENSRVVVVAAERW